jgi:hypothetical protein
VDSITLFESSKLFVELRTEKNVKSVDDFSSTFRRFEAPPLPFDRGSLPSAAKLRSVERLADKLVEFFADKLVEFFADKLVEFFTDTLVEFSAGTFWSTRGTGQGSAMAVLETF